LHFVGDEDRAVGFRRVAQRSQEFRRQVESAGRRKSITGSNTTGALNGRSSSTSANARSASTGM